jgi:hypothetical protein
MLKKIFKQPLFLTGFSVCAFFFILGLLGYSITPDSSVDSNQIMPEWSSLSPGATVKYVQKERTEERSIFFWLLGDDGLGEIISISQTHPISFRNNKITFFNEKRGISITLSLD